MPAPVSLPTRIRATEPDAASQGFKTALAGVDHALARGGQVTGTAMEEHGALMTGIETLLLTSAALMGSPGPSTISATAVGPAFGLRRAAPCVLGLAARPAALASYQRRPRRRPGGHKCHRRPIPAVFAGPRLGELPPATEGLLKTAVLALMVVTIYLAWVLAGASLSRVHSRQILS